ncbi:hypothetical protein [uncultured Sphingomonas sp.]|uniref:hypothetical protein n=1 Tax=uncultured Sphingomonas sp. TaxID=158754 RepID=UPI0035CC3B6F
MSGFSDVLKGIREVLLLLQNTVADLAINTRKLAGDLEALAVAHGQLRDRVSRLEGFLEGAAAMRRDPPMLPPA